MGVGRIESVVKRNVFMRDLKPKSLSLNGTSVGSLFGIKGRVASNDH